MNSHPWRSPRFPPSRLVRHLLSGRGGSTRVCVRRAGIPQPLTLPVACDRRLHDASSRGPRAASVRLHCFVLNAACRRRGRRRSEIRRRASANQRNSVGTVEQEHRLHDESTLWSEGAGHSAGPNPIWPTTAAIRTRPACSIRCRQRRAVTASPLDCTRDRRCWRCRESCSGMCTSSDTCAPACRDSASTFSCAARMSANRWTGQLCSHFTHPAHAPAECETNCAHAWRLGRLERRCSSRRSFLNWKIIRAGARAKIMVAIPEQCSLSRLLGPRLSYAEVDCQSSNTAACTSASPKTTPTSRH